MYLLDLKTMIQQQEDHSLRYLTRRGEGELVLLFL